MYIYIYGGRGARAGKMVVLDISLRGQGSAGFGRLDFDSEEGVCTGLGLMDHRSLRMPRGKRLA